MKDDPRFDPEPKTYKTSEGVPARVQSQLTVTEAMQWCLDRDLNPDDVMLTGGHFVWMRTETPEEVERRLAYAKKRAGAARAVDPRSVRRSSTPTSRSDWKRSRGSAMPETVAIANARKVLEDAGYSVQEPPEPKPEHHCAVCGKTDEQNRDDGYGDLIDVHVIVYEGYEGLSDVTRFFCDAAPGWGRGGAGRTRVRVAPSRLDHARRGRHLRVRRLRRVHALRGRRRHGGGLLMIVSNEKFAEVVENGADYIEKWGWHQGNLYNWQAVDSYQELPPACIQGALMVGNRSKNTSLGLLPMNDLMTKFHQAVPEVGCVTGWNDRVCESQQQALDMMRLAAKRLRIGWEK